MNSTRDKRSDNKKTMKAGRNGLLGLIAIILCSFATSAWAASWTLVNVSPTLPTGVTIVGVQAGSTQMWARDSNGDAYQYNGGTNTLTKVTTTPSIGELAVGVGESVFALDTSHNVYEYHFTKPKGFVSVPLPGGVEITTIGNAAEGVWGVDDVSGAVYVYNGSGFQPPPHGEPKEQFTTISVGDYGIGPWCLDTKGNAWLYNTKTQFFDGTNGVLETIAVGNGEVWGTTKANTVWTYDPSTEKWVQPDPSASLIQVSVGSDTNVWGVNSAGQVYKFNSSPKVMRFQLVSPQPPENISRVRASSGGAIYVIADTTGNVYKFK